MRIKDIPDNIRKLEDIPDSELRIYPKDKCIGFNSGYEIINGKVKWFNFDNNECSILSNMYPCKITYQGMNFNSLEQMYQYYVNSNNSEAQNLILKCKNGKEAKKISKRYYKYRDLSFYDKYRLMMTCLEQKYLCCLDFRIKLMETNDLPLVEVTTWFDVKNGTIDGSKLKNYIFNGFDVRNSFIGMNLTGRCIMKIREKMRNNF